MKPKTVKTWEGWTVVDKSGRPHRPEQPYIFSLREKAEARARWASEFGPKLRVLPCTVLVGKPAKRARGES